MLKAKLETSKRQSDVNSQILVNWQLATGSYMSSPEGFRALAEKATGKRQPDANSQILVNWHLTACGQMPIRFEAVIENNR